MADKSAVRNLLRLRLWSSFRSAGNWPDSGGLKRAQMKQFCTSSDHSGGAVNDLGIPTAPSENGPLCWRNWLTAPPEEVRSFEATLYTDAWLTGGPLNGLGPYEVYNTIPAVEGEMREGIVVRVAQHLFPRVRYPSSVKTDTSSWIGMTLEEEIASILSLALGVRVRSGGVTRTFEPGDPRGRPVAYGHRVPQWNPPRSPILPHLHRVTVSLDPAAPLIGRLPRMTATDAVALVRAARLYQSAIWVAEDDPDSAWIRLTSAVEVASATSGDVDFLPGAALAEWLPKLAELLNDRGGPALTQDVASHLSRLVGSTQKFLRFMAKFDPGPPPNRPTEEWAQVDWGDLRRSLNCIYGYRSQSLHGGSPFPGPLCAPPMRTDGQIPFEKPPGIASFSESTQWRSKDLPMYLWVFERTVRGALLNWWDYQVAHAGDSPTP
jgi:hypothetical protein